MPRVPDDPAALTHAWLTLARDTAVVARLESIYAIIAAEINVRGPACWASGRCCNFDKTGHRLYVTGLEAAYTVARLPTVPRVPPTPTIEKHLPVLPSPTRPSSSSSSPVLASAIPSGEPLSLATLSLTQLAAARAQGGCPFQSNNLCTVHPIKPLGCRVYFCDRSAQEWQHDLTERMLREVRLLHDDFAIDYRYGEWRSMLEMFAS